MVPITIEEAERKAEEYKREDENGKHLEVGQAIIIRHLEGNKSSAFSEEELRNTFGEKAITYFINKSAEGLYPNIRRLLTEDGIYFGVE